MLRIWRSLRLKIVKLLARGLEANVAQELGIAAPPARNEFNTQSPGLNCPRCGTKNQIDIFDLLTIEFVDCSKCNLRLHIQKENSQDSLMSIQKLKGELERIRQKT